MANSVTITGTQLQKFNQGDLIELLQSLYGDVYIEDFISDSIADGICYMLSIEWLLKLLDNNELPPDNVYKSKYIDDCFYYKQIANNYYTYSEDFKRTHNYPSPHPGAEPFIDTQFYEIDEYYVSSCSKGSHHVIDYNLFFTNETDNEQPPISQSDILKIADLISNDRGLLLTIYVFCQEPGNSFAHEMAIWQHDNKYYFFDPNLGVFMLTDLTNIADDVRSIYIQDLAIEKIKFTLTEIQ